MENFNESPFFTRHPDGGEVVTRAGIAGWIDRGIEEGATHMVVVCDTWDYDDFPVYVEPDEDVREVEKKYKNKDMYKVMEVYWLGGNLDEQLAMHRSFTYGPEDLK